MNFETSDERVLDALGSRSFLRFWSYSNVFRDQGINGANGNGKEICDFIVVFGKTILLFSDKRIAYPIEKVTEITAWNRWYKRAIENSAKQLQGAERWVTTHPSRVFLDKGCTMAFPISIPSDLEIHKIVVTHGAEQALQTIHGEKSFAFVNNDPALYEVNQRDLKNGEFYHVFTGDSLAFVLGEINTCYDFVEYLKKRRSVFESGNELRVSKESDFVHGFFKVSGPSSDKPLIEEFAEKTDDKVIVELEGIPSLLNDPIYITRKKDDVVSLVWDHLIEHISMHVAKGTTVDSNTSGIAEDEVLLRTMADTSRLERRALGKALFEMWVKVEPSSRGTRFYFNRRSSVCYLFFFCYPNDGSFSSEAQYRQIKRDLLTDYMQIYGHEKPEYSWIMGIAFSSRIDDHTELAQFHQVIDNGGVDFAMLENVLLDVDQIVDLERMKLDLIERGFFTESRTPVDQHHELFEGETDLTE